MKSGLKLNLIAAACDNMGIGFKGDLPWHLKNELRHFSRTTKKVQDSAKKNCIIMGRKTYFGIPESKRPLADRVNIILTSEPDKYVFPSEVIVAKSMQEALDKIQEPELLNVVENVWIVGGNSVYQEVMESSLCHKIYLTKVMGHFECDTFFPPLTTDFVQIPNDPDISTEIQEENGIKYQYQVFQKKPVE